MKRETIAMRIKPGMKEEFRRRCAEIAPELLAPGNLHTTKNFSVWCVEDLVFGYSEEYGVTEGAVNEEMTVMKFAEAMRNCCDCFGDPVNNPMRLMYEDIGVVREDKSLIRHRVFVTRLKPGCAEEYKRRHDELAASRGGRVNPGPESNFTIWNAGDYIFGYCELDKSMEHEPTEEEMKSKIKWETRMLEIMDWLTDDVDWLTGLKHERIELILRQN